MDDNADGAEMLAAVLNVDDHQALIAHDGRTALQLAAKHQPNVVFLDIGLPDVGHPGVVVIGRPAMRPAARCAQRDRP